MNATSLQLVTILLTFFVSICNILVTIFNGRRVENYKKKLEVKTLKLTRLWNISAEIEKFEPPSESLSNILKSGEGSPNYIERVANYLNYNNYVYESIYTIYFKYRHWFGKNERETIEARKSEYDKLQNRKTLLVMHNQKNPLTRAIVEELDQLPYDIYMLASLGAEEILKIIQSIIEQLENEFQI